MLLEVFLHQRLQQVAAGLPGAFCSTRISPSGLSLAKTQAFIAATRASRLMKSICKARMPKSRLRCTLARLLANWRRLPGASAVWIVARWQQAGDFIAKVREAAEVFVLVGPLASGSPPVDLDLQQFAEEGATGHIRDLVEHLFDLRLLARLPRRLEAVADGVDFR